jgi:predicted nucleic acid-binding protein
MQRFLLDTNMLLGFTRCAAWAKEAYESHNLGSRENLVFTSVICSGEILALAERNGWGEGKRDALEKVLNDFSTVGINQPQIISAYARIHAWTHGKQIAGCPADPPRPAISMKQNDIWIAAVTHVSRALLLTTDKDFDHLNGVWLTRILVDQHRS